MPDCTPLHEQPFILFIRGWTRHRDGERVSKFCCRCVQLSLFHSFKAYLFGGIPPSQFVVAQYYTLHLCNCPPSLAFMSPIKTWESRLHLWCLTIFKPQLSAVSKLISKCCLKKKIMPVQKSWDHMFQSTDELTWWKFEFADEWFVCISGTGNYFCDCSNLVFSRGINLCDS